jgi:predicted molibdopterin-dependent oxidoreductase YjgC
MVVVNHVLKVISAPLKSQSIFHLKSCLIASVAFFVRVALVSQNRLPAIHLLLLNERGALQQVGIYENDPFESYFSGNTVQICPVGALTGASYRFRARPFDLVSTPSACEHCASGCDMRTDVRRGKTLRRLAGDDASSK